MVYLLMTVVAVAVVAWVATMASICSKFETRQQDNKITMAVKKTLNHEFRSIAAAQLKMYLVVLDDFSCLKFRLSEKRTKICATFLMLSKRPNYEEDFLRKSKL